MIKIPKHTTAAIINISCRGNSELSHLKSISVKFGYKSDKTLFILWGGGGVQSFLRQKRCTREI